MELETNDDATFLIGAAKRGSCGFFTELERDDDPRCIQVPFSEEVLTEVFCEGTKVECTSIVRQAWSYPKIQRASDVLSIQSVDVATDYDLECWRCADYFEYECALVVFSHRILTTFFRGTETMMVDVDVDLLQKMLHYWPFDLSTDFFYYYLIYCMDLHLLSYLEVAAKYMVANRYVYRAVFLHHTVRSPSPLLYAILHGLTDVLDILLPLYKENGYLRCMECTRCPTNVVDFAKTTCMDSYRYILEYYPDLYNSFPLLPSPTSHAVTL